MYNFTQLSKESQNKAIHDYLMGWLETHPNDFLMEEEIFVLLKDNNSCYNIDGEFISE